MHYPEKIVSGGQTGVDRAAWDAALDRGIGMRGWIPKGRKAEDGRIPDRFANLTETETEDPLERTQRNVRTSDATLVITDGAESEGTRDTIAAAQSFDKPHLVVRLDQGGHEGQLALIHAFLELHRPRQLNVAGPRESQSPGIHDKAKRLLLDVFCVDRSDPDLLKDLNANFRHWDSIRWLVPFWYFSAAGASYAFGVKEGATGVPIVAGAVGIVGLLCFLLIERTTLYHKRQYEILSGRSPATALNVLAPIEFGSGTATYWFSTAVLVVSVLSLSIAVFSGLDWISELPVFAGAPEAVSIDEPGDRAAD